MDRRRIRREALQLFRERRRHTDEPLDASLQYVRDEMEKRYGAGADWNKILELLMQLLPLLIALFGDD